MFNTLYNAAGYYNRAGLLRWKNYMGDWRDAKNKPQGDIPFALAAVIDDEKGKYVEWDVSNLVRAWIEGEYPNQGMFLRAVQRGGTIVFCSREHPQREHRPRLVVKGERSSLTLSPRADTFLDKSTYRSQGSSQVLKVSGDPHHTLLRFALDRKKIGALSSATLRLYTTKQYGPAYIGVFRCAQGHDLPPSGPVVGLAAKYTADKGIRSDADVIFFTDFESEKWADEWTGAAHLKVIDTVDADPQRKFESLQEKALRVKIAKGSTGALSTTYKFKSETGEEPEEIFFRYYLRLANDWHQTVQGGKLPGISGTYGVAGWGGRKSDGTDGWSARGAFQLTIPDGNPLAGLTPIGTYCYHADMKGQYGDIWPWLNGYRGFLANNRWYSIEQYLRLNTPGEKDGILKAWVRVREDGHPLSPRGQAQDRAGLDERLSRRHPTFPLRPAPVHRQRRHRPQVHRADEAAASKVTPCTPCTSGASNGYPHGRDRLLVGSVLAS